MDKSNITSLFIGILITIPIISYYYKKKLNILEIKYNNISDDLIISQNENELTIKEKIIEISKRDVEIEHKTQELLEIKKNKDDNKIKEIYNSPIELAKRFDNKGYVIMYHNLSSVNIELNEFIELMRMYELPQLDGCDDPINCKCMFRHKRCRIFMVRKYSINDDINFYSPSCNGVVNLIPTNDDIKNESILHKFIKLYTDKFNKTVCDLINYVKYIVDPNNKHRYIADISLVAEPYYKEYNQISSNGYGSSELYNAKNDTFTIDTSNYKYKTQWHQDQFIESKTKKLHSYDIIATFILNTNNIMPHKLIIGELKNTDNKQTTLNLEEHIVNVSSIELNESCHSDVGYILDQRRNIFHKHTDIKFNDIESRRNVCTIRIKYLR